MNSVIDRRPFLVFFLKAFTVLVLVALVSGVIGYKFYLLNKLPFFDRSNDEAFFWTESAFHYRHFLSVAEGKGIPWLDREIQYPEGIDVARDETPVMDIVYGTLYHLFFKSTPPRLFIIWAVLIFSSLSIVAVFLAGRILWRSKVAAFMIAFLYGFAPASLVRNAGGGYIREDFALPFIFFSFACFLRALRKDQVLVSFLGSLLLVMALASWHVSQLYLSLFVGGFVAVYAFHGREALPRKGLLVFISVVMIAAVVLPVLRAKYFVFSPAAMLGYGLVAVSWVPFFRPRKPMNIIIGLCLLSFFLAVSFLIGRSTEGYSHVYELIKYKIMFLGRLPDDPSRLSFEAKTMWTSAFVSPGLAEIPLLLSFLTVFAPAGLALMVHRIFMKRSDGAEVMATYFAVVTFLFLLMIHRMSVFAAFFLAILVGVLILYKNRTFRYAFYACFAACVIIQVAMMGSFSLRAFRPNQYDVRHLYHFIRESTEKKAVILSSFELGPGVALYTGRPVILHSKFESKLLRDKVKEVYTAAFAGEDDFYQVCQKYNADIFVYEAGMVLSSGPGSFNYRVGAGPIGTNCAAFLFHFAPDKLKHFGLIYQNSLYRVFKVGASPAFKKLNIKYEPIYDLDNFLSDKKIGEFIDDAVLESGRVNLGRSETHRKIGDRLFLSGDYQAAVLQYERALRIDPQNKRVVWTLAQALLKAGDKGKATEVFRTALTMDPNYDVTILDIQSVDVWLAMAIDELQRKRYDNAARIFKKAIHVKPDADNAYFGLGETLFRQGNLEEAKVAYKKAIALNPQHYKAYENLAKIYAAQGDKESATMYVKRSLSINPNQPHLYNILSLLQSQRPTK